MAIFDFFLSRNRAAANVDAYLGHPGRLFYDTTDKVLRIGNGTPGGERIRYPVATETTVGGIKAGPGANVSVDGTLTIDTAGLPLSFGDFTANVNMLTLVNEDQDMVLITQGNAEIQLVGNIGFYKSNGGGMPDPADRYFEAREDGQITIIVPAADALLGAVEIVGGPTTNTIAPGIEGAMLHITGIEDIPARVYIDGDSDYVSLVARRWNGNVATPTQVLANEDVLRINSTAATNAGVGNVAMAQIRMTALENQTTTAQGSQIVFTVTPVGSAATSRVDVANVSVANGVWATKFTGNVIGNVIGNVTGNVTGDVTGNVSGSAGSVVNALTAGTYLTSGGTYNGSTARTFAVDATTANTASKVVARDASGDFAARHISAKIKHATRDAGSVNGGLTINYNTDDWIVGTFTSGFTITHSNLSAGMDVTVVLYNSSGAGEDTITFGVGTENTTTQTSTIVVNDTNLIILKFYSFGTTTDDLYCQVNYTNVE